MSGFVTVHWVPLARIVAQRYQGLFGPAECNRSGPSPLFAGAWTSYIAYKFWSPSARVLGVRPGASTPVSCPSTRAGAGIARDWQ